MFSVTYTRVYVTDFHVTAPVLNFDMRKVELMPLEQRKLTFDSHAMVTELENSGEEPSPPRRRWNLHFASWMFRFKLQLLFVCLCPGFEKRQAELIVSALVTLTTANMDVVYKDMVTKSHQVQDPSAQGFVSFYTRPWCQTHFHTFTTVRLDFTIWGSLLSAKWRKMRS